MTLAWKYIHVTANSCIIVKPIAFILIHATLLRFGESAEVLHPLDQPFSSNSGGFILQHLTFTQTKTNFVQVQDYILNSIVLRQV